MAAPAKQRDGRFIRLSDEQLRAFARAIDAIGQRERDDLGQEDSEYANRIMRLSRLLRRAGWTLMVVAVEPVGFTLGAVAMASHQLLHSWELGHHVLHGAYDRLSTDDDLHSRTFEWAFPIDEVMWRETHNLQHHTFTNVIGRDHDATYGSVRLNGRVPHRWFHYLQLPSVLMGASFVGVLGHFHVAGVYELFLGENVHDGDAGERPGLREIVTTVRRSLRKPSKHVGEYYVKPSLLAGPLFWKVILGTFLAGRLRDLYIAAGLLGGHVSSELAEFPVGTRAGGKAQWYVMQIESTHDFEMPRPFGVLFGALNRQSIHHIFPDLPANRIRKVTPEVRAVCQRHGVAYRTGSWSGFLGRFLTRIAQLSLPGGENPASVGNARR